MFTACRSDSGARITTLDVEWLGREADLRALATAGALLCPGCRQTLCYHKASEHRRPHFAHRSVGICQLDRLSAEVIEGKALLYVWLRSKFPSGVEMDVDANIPEWDRVADVLVRRPGLQTLAYWLFDRAPRGRDGLVHGVPKEIGRQIVFTETACVPHGRGPEVLALSAAHRDFIVRGIYDDGHGGQGHLQFLDTRTGHVAIHRGLRCVHEPAVFTCGKVREGRLDDALIAPSTGELVFQIDLDEHIARMERRAAAAAASCQPRSSPRRVPTPAMNFVPRPPVLADPPVSCVSTLNAPLACEVCGCRTADWVSARPGQGTCLCRDCARRGANHPR